MIHRWKRIQTECRIGFNRIGHSLLFSETTPTLLGILGILATGVAGLLGVVVKWLLGHVTELNKQVMELIQNHSVVMKDMQESLKDSLAQIVDHCDKEIMRQSEVQQQRDALFEAALGRYSDAMEKLNDSVIALKNTDKCQAFLPVNKKQS